MVYVGTTSDMESDNSFMTLMVPSLWFVLVEPVTDNSFILVTMVFVVITRDSVTDNLIISSI